MLQTIRYRLPRVVATSPRRSFLAASAFGHSGGLLASPTAAALCFAIPNFLVLEYFEQDEPTFTDLIPGGLVRGPGGVSPTMGPGLGASVTDAFLRKYQFDPARTDAAERQMFDTVK